MAHLGKKIDDRVDWLDGETVRPYVFVREDMRVEDPGSKFELNWFDKEPLWLNPLHMDQVTYTDQILNLESRAFAHNNLMMPRWVFYDCAIMPGFVAGFAYQTEKLPMEMQIALAGKSSRKWTPISLFIIIPTMKPGEWFAHNLCSINSLLEREKRLYGLGFLTKAFGLWYANIETCCGATQWGSPATKLHSQYGPMEVLTSYTPAHDYPKTLTYRAQVDPTFWPHFFSKTDAKGFEGKFTKTDKSLNPTSDKDMIDVQRSLENHEGPYYLSPSEIRGQKLTETLNLYTKN